MSNKNANSWLQCSIGSFSQYGCISSITDTFNTNTVWNVPELRAVMLYPIAIGSPVCSDTGRPRQCSNPFHKATVTIPLQQFYFITPPTDENEYIATE